MKNPTLPPSAPWAVSLAPAVATDSGTAVLDALYSLVQEFAAAPDYPQMDALVTWSEDWFAAHEANFTSEEREKQAEIRCYTYGNDNSPCDFFLIAPHCEGGIDFQYFLSKVGLPTTGFEYIEGSKNDLRRAFAFTREQKKTHPYVGITIEKVLTAPWAIRKLAQYHVPAFCIVGDPAALLSGWCNHLRNYNVIDLVMKKSGAIATVDECLWTSLRDINSYTCFYSFRIAAVHNPASLHFIDFQDIQRNPVQTVRTLTDFFGLTWDHGIDACLQTVYDRIGNMIYVFFPLLALNLAGGNFAIAFCRKDSFDYIYNFYLPVYQKYHFICEPYQIIGELSVDGEPYFLLSNDAEIPAQCMEQINAVESLRNAVTNYIRHGVRRVAHAELLIRRNEVTLEDTIPRLRDDPQLYAAFCHNMVADLEIVRQNAPELLQQWSGMQRVIRS